MSGPETKTLSAKALRAVERWKLEVISGPSKGLLREVTEGVVRIGSASSNDIVLEDSKISRHHVVLEVRKGRLRARDLGSKNGTFFQRSRIDVAELPQVGGVLTLGESEIAFVPADAPGPVTVSPRTSCGPLLGRSEVMRGLFAQIERIATSTASVLVQGETGTGKELVAAALHELSERRKAPLVVVDCGSIARELVESELFGHVRGAFTGANDNRVGAFERADGGTLFLDEIGELEPGLQPRLLRALETGELKPLGSNRTVRVDVRVIAATLRDLATEVREHRFREDLYYRLAVVRLDVPPLRDRPGDLPMLAEHFLARLGAPPLGVEAMRVLESYAWPGNVRQLKNALERAAAMASGGVLTIAPDDLEMAASPSPTSPTEDLARPYKEAKDAVVSRFTKEYLEALIARSGGNISAAAREAQVDRNWLVALARRHGVPLRD